MRIRKRYAASFLLFTSLCQANDCPSDSKLVHGSTPDGKGEWCETSSEKKQGPYRVHHPSKKKKIETYYSNDVMNGSFSQWNEEGVLIKQGEFKDGKMVDVWKRWDDEGQITDEGAFVNGQPEGHWKYYKPDGSLDEEGEFENGVQVCYWKKYKDDGSVVLEKRENSKLTSCNPLLPMSFFKFRVQGIVANQSTSGGGAVSALVQWTPRWRWLSWLHPGVDLGATYFISSLDTPKYFPAFFYFVTARLVHPKLEKFFLEPRIGFETWMYSGTILSYGASIGYQLPFRFIESALVAGFQLATVPNNITTEYMVGVDFDLGTLRFGK